MVTCMDLSPKLCFLHVGTQYTWQTESLSVLGLWTLSGSSEECRLHKCCWNTGVLIFYSSATLNSSSTNLSKTHSNTNHEKLVHSAYRNLKVSLDTIKIQVQPKTRSTALAMQNLTEKFCVKTHQHLGGGGGGRDCLVNYSRSRCWKTHNMQKKKPLWN